MDGKGIRNGNRKRHIYGYLSTSTPLQLPLLEMVEHGNGIRQSAGSFNAQPLEPCLLLIIGLRKKGRRSFCNLYQRKVKYPCRLYTQQCSSSKNSNQTPYAMLCTTIHISHLPHLDFPIFSPISIKIVLIDLIRHDHHPEQKHRPDDIKRKRGLPILTDPLRLQPRQRRLPVRQARTRLVEVAVAVDGAGGAVELDGGFDEAG